MTEITIIENGPALIKPSTNDYVVIEGKDFSHIGALDKAVAICRYGKSANSIMCDGSHKKKDPEIKTQE